VAKRLDRFLINDSLLNNSLTIKQWIGFGGLSDHHPIFLELRQGSEKPTSPFKFNKTWLEDESFLKMIKEHWIPFRQDLTHSTAFQFTENLRRIKEKVKPWAFQKRKLEDKELKEIEFELKRFSEDEGDLLSTTESKFRLLQLEKKRIKLLKEKEETWRLKSRAIWLESGDENTKFFQAYAKGRKNVNTIWHLKDQDKNLETSFEGMSTQGKNYFQNLFKADSQATIEEVVKVAQYFPRFVEEEENHYLMEEVTEKELLEVLHSFQKDKSPGPDGWTIEFFLGCYEIIGTDLLKMVEDTRISGRIPQSLNSTFISLIPKMDNPETLDEFRPISLCNCAYKIVSKIIARRFKKILSKNISEQQFGFLEGRQIHEAIGIAQEGLHSMKTRKLKGAVLKIDLSKAYDRVSWLYIRLLLTHLGFEVPFITWIMSCLTSTSFAVLINGSTSPFFTPERGLRQGCPLSPLLFLLVAEGLSRALTQGKTTGELSGIKISQALSLTHLLFVDDVLLFSGGSRREAETLRDILSLFSKATGMQINDRKSSLTTFLLSEEEELAHYTFFPFERRALDDGLKYLGFNLKPNDYRKEDWKWLLKKLDKRLNTWSHRWLSRAGRLVLVKSVLEAIPVYWMSLSWIPKGILDAARKLSSKFLWSGKKESHVIPWVRWEKIATPKALGGWG
jgi:hypothetical protein